jgi:hypothetical protein
MKAEGYGSVEVDDGEEEVMVVVERADDRLCQL